MVLHRAVSKQVAVCDAERRSKILSTLLTRRLQTTKVSTVEHKQGFCEKKLVFFRQEGLHHDSAPKEYKYRRTATGKVRQK